MEFKSFLFILVGFLIELSGLITTIAGFIILAQTGMNAALIVGPLFIVIGLGVMVYGVIDFIPDELKADFKAFFGKD